MTRFERHAALIGMTILMRDSNVDHVGRSTLKSSQLLFEALQGISNLSFGLALLDNREKSLDRLNR